MPELAEVAIYASQLNKEYGGQTLNAVEFIGGRFLKSEYDAERIDLQYLDYPLIETSMHSKGKFLYWSMFNANKSESFHFFFSLAMTGSFGKKQKHSAIRFEFDNGEVFFNDPRHFGSFRISNGDLELQTKLATLGWDALKEPKMPTDLPNKIRKYNAKKIGEFLMEQGTLISGVGNYLRSEVLWASKINPHRLISSLSDQEIKTICNNLIDTVRRAYDHGGATISTYSDLYGIAGSFFQQFKVYGKKTDPDGNLVIREKDKNGRMLHYVLEVQL